MTTEEILSFGSDIFKNGAIISISYIIILFIIRSFIKKTFVKYISKKIRLKSQEYETTYQFVSNIIKAL